MVDYNQYMLGVDKMDQLVSYYSFLHKSVKWWKKVFFWIVEVVVVNFYIIYKEQTSANRKQPITHVAYRPTLIETLSEALVFLEHVLDLAPLRHLNICNLCAVKDKVA